jgi:predicted GIY-YIG superfamily endonuclease
VTLIFYEAFLHQQDATRREQYFKTTAGKRALKLMMREYFVHKQKK